MPEEVTEALQPFGSTAPTLLGFAMKAARKFAEVSDEMSDDEAFNAGFLTPELIELFVALLNEVLNGCLDNNTSRAFARVRQFQMQTARNRVMDNIRLGLISNRWFERLGLPRVRGDVVRAREALVFLCEDCEQEDLAAAQAEAMFLTI